MRAEVRLPFQSKQKQALPDTHVPGWARPMAGSGKGRGVEPTSEWLPLASPHPP